MKKEDFYFDLPQELIAQYPLTNRSDSKLLAYCRQGKTYAHHKFPDLVDFLNEGDVLVMNDSRVIAARLYGRKESGGKVELLLERIIDDNSFLAHIKASKSPKIGTKIYINDKWSIEVSGRNNDLFVCKSFGLVQDLFAETGHIPLPPYITRKDEISDKSRYQTVYAKHDGSVAAPTAGLHFDDNILHKLQSKGVKLAYTTLHVGSGTFRPVRVDNILDHQMHSEWYEVSEPLAATVNNAKENGKRVIAVGTTAMRCLESAAFDDGKLRVQQGDTNIFIYPGYIFKLCDGLVTNFHLPESTLLMLVSAFMGYKPAMELYRLAVLHQYRFFSYGDACFLM